MSDKTEEFVKAVTATIVDDSNDIDISAYEMEGLYSPAALFNNMTDDEKKTMLWIIRQTQIDTISEMFGIIDGSSTLNDCDSDVDMFIDGNDTNQLLQDLYLEHVQETELGY